MRFCTKCLENSIMIKQTFRNDINRLGRFLFTSAKLPTYSAAPSYDDKFRPDL